MLARTDFIVKVLCFDYTHRLCLVNVIKEMVSLTADLGASLFWPPPASPFRAALRGGGEDFGRGGRDWVLLFVDALDPMFQSFIVCCSCHSETNRIRIKRYSCINTF